ncbi:MAG: hypothetical protein DYG89_17145 [Caldilinea sp. CFX5]|nr:hypothetical protein [Caldilinea sp. CFX5]
MLDPRSFTLARAICDEQTQNNAFHVTESWWAAAPKPQWQQRFQQIAGQLRNRLLGLGQPGRVSVNEEWREPAVS